MSISTEEAREAYNEGYSASSAGYGKNSNPYIDIKAKYWSDGYTEQKTMDWYKLVIWSQLSGTVSTSSVFACSLENAIKRYNSKNNEFGHYVDVTKTKKLALKRLLEGEIDERLE